MEKRMHENWRTIFEVNGRYCLKVLNYMQSTLSIFLLQQMKRRQKHSINIVTSIKVMKNERKAIETEMRMRTKEK